MLTGCWRVGQIDGGIIWRLTDCKIPRQGKLFKSTLQHTMLI